MERRTTGPQTDQKRHRGIVVFLLIAFGLSWTPFLPVLFDGEPLGVFLLPFAPAIAAIVVRRWVTREGFGDAGLRPNLRRWRLYLLAAGWPVAATMISVPLALVLGTAPSGFGMPWGVVAPDPLTLLSWLLATIAIAPIIFGEELGWRGYLQIRVFPGRPWRAALATGVIWGAWHYPLLLSSSDGDGNPLVTLFLFTIATTSASIFLGWLRSATGDVWVSSVGHGANNVTEDSWHRLAFTGDASGSPSRGGDVAVVIAEAMVLIGMVVITTVRQRSTHVPAQVAINLPVRTRS